LTSALVKDEWSTSSPSRFNPGKELPVPVYIKAIPTNESDGVKPDVENMKD
jgi:hypothetical protein